ncbi:MAG: PadR family transcriptional regulator [Chloroflexota bacterium]
MTNAKLAILSLIAESPRHGYEIEQIIEERGMREWTEIGFSSIYYILKQLEKSSLIDSQLRPAEGRGPARRVYQITQEGWKTLEETTLEALTTPKQSFPSILLGMANLPILSQKQSLAALRTYQDGLIKRLTHVALQAESQHPLPDHVEMLFDYSLRMLEAEKGWVENVIQHLKEKQK